MGAKQCLSKSLNVFKWIPVLFIVAVAVWSYYAYVIQLCLLSVGSPAQKMLYLVFYHLFFIMFSWSYWQTVFTPVARVPHEFRPPTDVAFAFEHAETQQQQREILEEFSRNLPVVTRSLMGVRFCEKCYHIKPDRAHHCSVCECCVLKMDHHCPWVNTCVGWSNYKFFILFLGYAALYCIYVSLTSLPFFIAFWKNQVEAGPGKFHVLFLFFVATMFFISVSSLFSYHIYLLLLNRSTLESFRPPVFRLGPDKDGFHLGKFNNVAEIFGDDIKLWFFPIFTSKGDGVSYPQKTLGEEESNLLRFGRCGSSDESELNGLTHLTPSVNTSKTVERNSEYTSVLIEPV
ncbi:palmitoyltransferase ZDHHC15B-like isoform X2 [Artemia franciscana]|uniref:Palmitoyltransferase n=1 Tax=Artemia franciscana TaxID=6661 RepID=A0AA88I551_ARTSF|nr:hypothetical protein QYM36_010201 [Artemia franciscana]KAK2715525.1 hypothetical protein QYM36_010201 [Artemia franciscana]KAK2715530.1 hypothetical protein QYM36_010201 [Artemia franciscana]KAK2715532.1 hypothetical protein QYM36_010201 [Artemia franciscana]